MNVLSCFDGVSCAKVALDRAGIKVDKYFASEIDKYAIQISEKNYPDIIRLGDVRNVFAYDLKDIYGEFDLIIGGSPCFVAGTLVLTDNGYKAIEDIKVGDRVLTHKNRYKKVINTFVKQSNVLTYIKGAGSEEIVCTPNHPFYVREMTRKWNPSTRRSERQFSEPRWKEAGDLSKTDYWGIAINQEEKLPEWNGCEKRINKTTIEHQDTLSELFSLPDFWWIVGRYIGDGWTRNYKRPHRIDSWTQHTIICCAKSEKEEITRVLDRLGKFNYTCVEERTVIKIRIYSKELAIFLDQFGKGALNKHLNKTILDLPGGLLHHFLEGYISADGHIKRTLGGYHFRCASTSQHLIYGIAQCTIKAYQRPIMLNKSIRPKTCVIEGRVVNQHNTYELQYRNFVGKQSKAFYEDGYLWQPIKKVRTQKEDVTDVYNLEVEDDNSYTVNNIIVHNCQDLSIAGKREGLGGGAVELILRVREPGRGNQTKILYSRERGFDEKRMARDDN